jgi:hypothetical protein
MSATLKDPQATSGVEEKPDLRASVGLWSGAVVGALIGFKDEGRTPLVLFLGQRGSAAIAARTTVDLHGVHIGRQVLLVFERNDVTRPIIVGWLRSDDNMALNDASDSVEVDSDGERLIVTAKEQLVLRCGSASVTLTRAGKVLIQGTYVSSRASGVNRIKGGSVQLN